MQVFVQIFRIGYLWNYIWDNVVELHCQFCCVMVFHQSEKKFFWPFLNQIV